MFASYAHQSLCISWCCYLTECVLQKRLGLCFVSAIVPISSKSWANVELCKSSLVCSVCVCVCVCVRARVVVHSSLQSYAMHICTHIHNHTHTHTYTHTHTISEELCVLHRSDTDLMNMIMSLLQNLLAGSRENCELFKREGGEAILGQLIHEAKEEGLEVLATQVLCSFSTTW